MNKLSQYLAAASAAIFILAIAMGSAKAGDKPDFENRALSVAAQLVGGKNLAGVSCKPSRLEGSEYKTNCLVKTKTSRIVMECETVAGDNVICLPI